MANVKRYVAKYTYLSTSVKVKGETKRIVFDGGTNHPYFKGGKYYSSDKDEQEAIENSPSYGKIFKLDKDLAENNSVGEQDKPEETDDYLIIDSEVNGFQKAKAWLVNNRDVSLEDVKSKDLLKSKAEELKIKFKNYKL